MFGDYLIAACGITNDTPLDPARVPQSRQLPLLVGGFPCRRLRERSLGGPAPGQSASDSRPNLNRRKQIHVTCVQTLESSIQKPTLETGQTVVHVTLNSGRKRPDFIGLRAIKRSPQHWIKRPAMNTTIPQIRRNRAWWEGGKIPNWILASSIVVVLVAVFSIYVEFGGSDPYIAEFFILPVLIAAFRYEVVGGMVSGIVVALFAGPLAFEIMQPEWLMPGKTQYLDWLMLLVYTSIVGTAVGAVFLLLRRHMAETVRILNHDLITGLPNLEGLRSLMAGRLADGNRPFKLFSKYAIRINNYQSLVNAFGYRFADEFIRKISLNLRELFPAPNILARVSPSTLAVVSEGRPESRLTTCRRLLDQQQANSETINGIPVYPEISIGIAWNKLDKSDIDHLFSNAELAATEARMAPDRIVLFSPSTRSGQRERIQLLGGFSQALKNGHIRLEYQPKLDLATQKIVSVEALARWSDPEHGAIPPTKFIPLLEETRLINTLSAWIIKEAIRQIRAWRDGGIDIGMSINVSARNFDFTDTFSGLKQMLEKHDVDGSKLEMEITETSFIDINERKLKTIAGIRDIGVRMAIDDFGTGYASLAYLRQLPIDVLKLDSSFVNKGLDHPHDLLMVKRMVQIAKDRNLLVVAEGVETEATLRSVRDIGIDQAQGHFISRSLPPDELESLVIKWNSEASHSNSPRRPDDTEPETAS